MLCSQGPRASGVFTLGTLQRCAWRTKAINVWLIQSHQLFCDLHISSFAQIVIKWEDLWGWGVGGVIHHPSKVSFSQWRLLFVLRVIICKEKHCVSLQGGFWLGAGQQTYTSMSHQGRCHLWFTQTCHHSCHLTFCLLQSLWEMGL